MSRRLLWVVSIIALGSLAWVGSAAEAQQPGAPSPQNLWADFNHYVLVARPTLAEAAGQALLQSVDDAQLLEVVETGDYDNWEQTLQRAQRFDELMPVALQLEARIQQGRIQVSRDTQRIADDIQRLDAGQRAYRNAVQRLAAAGQFAAPQLVATLIDDDAKPLQPYVITAMTSIGRPLVYPVSVALPNLPPPTQARLAQVLADIGYPEALPYLKRLAEDPKTNDATRRVVDTAITKLAAAAGIRASTPAAQLFLGAAQRQYMLGALGDPASLSGYDGPAGIGVIWEYNDRLGLVHVEVPSVIYPDARAMRSAKAALELDASLTPALTTYLAANLRRDLRLPDGANDLSYPAEAQSPAYYAMLAGPARVQDVLATALNDGDPGLALASIDVLGQISGASALLEADAAVGVSPLLAAVSYPNRLVRFRAAQALANARPESTFDGAFRVVPVLAEAVRQTQTQYAAVIAPTQESLNTLMSAVNGLGFQTVGGLSLSDIDAEVRSLPAVDVLVIDASPEALEATYNAASRDYRLGGVPMVALVPLDTQARLATWAKQRPRLTLAAETTDPTALRGPVESAVARYAGSISPEMSTEMAVEALGVLKEIASGRGPVYRIQDAQAPLIAALGDNRPDVVLGAAAVLALINSPEAQSAIADAASGASGTMQVALLDELATSATYHGNQLVARQIDAVQDLVATSSGNLAEAAARAHGALGLPTADAVTAILR